MGLLNKLFGGGEKVEREEKVLPWIPLSDVKQLDYIEKKSSIKAQVIFKHSTRCGISNMVQRQFISEYNFSEKDLDLYYLDILSYRQVSDEVGYKFQLIHESPQLLVIKNGTLVANASHGQINQVDLSRFV
ncbi:bacillithiol system redox-active protein YtxJ [Hyunsoonleella pacifica]|uniref:Bacillithiol system redox-active protein YtxJ n=1 Tax=Hyunsoonleella pacifica TaxID=1080224 RepID=A0A4Q9FN98_9FLAO|nr:bacillithiol system redox-active protein YtxJ [Hyunsoonleella pacifica]TBN13784.1 bacillithiol system redox-active protein YtxJ [Hyunsoonleella pacifica]GGD25628.1 thioredoxin family protein [Hyunsoonleella pacifica]